MMILLTTVVGLLFVTTVSLATCPDGWTAVGEACLYVSDTPETYYNAEKKCEELSGKIASCLTQDELNELVTQSQSKEFYIGLTNAGYADYVNLDGSTPAVSLPWAVKKEPKFGLHHAVLKKGALHSIRHEESRLYACKQGTGTCERGYSCDKPNYIPVGPDACFKLLKVYSETRKRTSFDYGLLKCEEDGSILASCLTSEQSVWVESYSRVRRGTVYVVGEASVIFGSERRKLANIDGSDLKYDPKLGSHFWRNRDVNTYGYFFGRKFSFPTVKVFYNDYFCEYVPNDQNYCKPNYNGIIFSTRNHKKLEANQISS